MVPGLTPVYKIFDVNSVYPAAFIELFSKKHFLFAGVANVQAAMDQLRQPGQGFSSTTLQSLGRAMANVRKHIEGITTLTTRTQEHAEAREDNTVLISILTLALCARAMGDMNSYEAHWQTVAAFVKAKGGLDRLLGQDELTRQFILQWESFCAFGTGHTTFTSNVPVYHPTYPQHPFPEYLRCQISVLPIGFQRLALKKQLALDVINIFSRAAAFQAKCDWRNPILEPIQTVQRSTGRFGDFGEACTCWNAPDEIITITSKAIDYKATCPNFEKMMVLTLTLYILDTFSPARSVTALYIGSRMRLTTDLPRKLAVIHQHREYTRFRDATTDLQEGEPFEFQIEESALLWMGWVVIDAWRSPTNQPQPQGLQLLELLKHYLAKYSTWDEIEATLRLFLCNRPFLRRCQRYWGDLSKDTG